MEEQHQDFLRKVQLMRTAQNKYFSTRSPIALREAKRLETEVDKYIDEHLEQRPQPKQGEFF